MNTNKKIDLKYFSVVLLLGFIFIVNTIPVSFGQMEPPTIIQEEQAQKLSENTANKITGLVCPVGSNQFFIDDSNFLQKIDLAVLGYTLGEVSKPITCLEKGGALDSNGQFICNAPKQKYYDPANPNQILGCIVPPTKVIRVGDSKIQQTDLSGLKAVIPAYVPRVEIPCNTKIAGGECPANWKTDLGSYVGRLYQFGLMIAGIIAFAVIIYGAAQYTLSAGGFASKEDAKDIMLNAIYGLLLLFGAYLVLYTINPNLVKLGNFKIEPIDLNQFNPPEQVYISENNNQLPESSGTAGIPGCLVAVSEAGGLLGTGFQAGVEITSDEGTQQYGTDTTRKMLCTSCEGGKDGIYTLENGQCCLSIITKSCVSCAGLKNSIGAQLKSGFNKDQAQAILISDYGQNQGTAIISKCGF